MIITLLSGATTVAAGSGVNVNGSGPNRWVQAVLSGTGSPSATVEIDGSNDNVNWIPLAVITLPKSGTGALTDATATTQTAEFMRGNITAISGTNTAITLTSAQ
jgi:hypothetical protein